MILLFVKLPLVYLRLLFLLLRFNVPGDIEFLRLSFDSLFPLPQQSFLLLEFQLNPLIPLLSLLLPSQSILHCDQLPLQLLHLLQRWSHPSLNGLVDGELLLLLLDLL